MVNVTVIVIAFARAALFHNYDTDREQSGLHGTATVWCFGILERKHRGVSSPQNRGLKWLELEREDRVCLWLSR